MATTDYGKDMGALEEIEPDRLVTGKTLVAENAWRCLRTRKGSLLGCPLYGCAEVFALARRTDAVWRMQLAATISSALRRDERISWVGVQVYASALPNQSYTLRIQVQCSAGPFALVVGVDDLTPQLLGIET